MDSLLPPASTPFEKSFDAHAARRLALIPHVVTRLWNADTCPLPLLPWLAWSVSVDEWDPLWSEDIKRAAIRLAPLIHRRKGTPWAVRNTLSSLGQPDAALVERADYIRCDGSTVADGSRTCGGRWATFAVKLYRPITIGQAWLIKRAIESTKRLSIRLLKIDFSAAAFRCDGTVICNGDYACGAVDTTI